MPILFYFINFGTDVVKVRLDNFFFKVGLTKLDIGSNLTERNFEEFCGRMQLAGLCLDSLKFLLILCVFKLSTLFFLL